MIRSNLPATIARPAPGGNRYNTRRATHGTSESFAPPKRAHVNFIPSSESLGALIENAVSALRQGVTWDRGTILNLLA